MAPVDDPQVELYRNIPSEVLPYLYISGIRVVKKDHLERLGVTHVVSIVEKQPNYPNLTPPLKVLHISLPDTTDANILQYLDTTTQFIASALSPNANANTRNVVLVHCMMGISRSATVICAYLIAARLVKTEGDAIRILAGKRPIIQPNAGFCGQLWTYAARLRRLDQYVDPPLLYVPLSASKRRRSQTKG